MCTVHGLLGSAADSFPIIPPCAFSQYLTGPVAPPQRACLLWLQDRAPSQVAMAVTMVHNSQGCLNPSPAGKITTHNQRHKIFLRKST